jgi:hypothetical protein
MVYSFKVNNFPSEQKCEVGSEDMDEFKTPPLYALQGYSNHKDYKPYSAGVTGGRKDFTQKTIEDIYGELPDTPPVYAPDVLPLLNAHYDFTPDDADIIKDEDELRQAESLINVCASYPDDVEYEEDTEENEEDC